MMCQLPKIFISIINFSLKLKDNSIHGGSYSIHKPDIHGNYLLSIGITIVRQNYSLLPQLIVLTDFNMNIFFKFRLKRAKKCPVEGYRAWEDSLWGVSIMNRGSNLKHFFKKSKNFFLFF